MCVCVCVCVFVQRFVEYMRKIATEKLEEMYRFVAISSTVTLIRVHSEEADSTIWRKCLHLRDEDSKLKSLAYNYLCLSKVFHIFQPLPRKLISCLDHETLSLSLTHSLSISCPVEYADCTSAEGKTRPTSVLYMTLNNEMVWFLWCWGFDKHGAPIHCHCSQVHSGPGGSSW